MSITNLRLVNWILTSNRTPVWLKSFGANCKGSFTFVGNSKFQFQGHSKGNFNSITCCHDTLQLYTWTTVADPGFPRGGGANSPGGASTYDFAKFSQKLHEIERIWTPRGGRASKIFLCRSATGLDVLIS